MFTLLASLTQSISAFILLTLATSNLMQPRLIDL